MNDKCPKPVFGSTLARKITAGWYTTIWNHTWNGYGSSKRIKEAPYLYFHVYLCGSPETAEMLQKWHCGVNRPYFFHKINFFWRTFVIFGYLEGAGYE